MKENSIEEDIKNAEHFIKSIKTDKEYKEENGWHGYYNKEIVELARILEFILSDYKRVLEINEVLLKENEELKGTLRDTQNSWFEDTKKMEKLKKDFNEANNIAIKNMTEYVSKAEIKDKIEDLKMSGGSDGKDNTENTARELAIEALQDILEESEG